eukprot:353925-Chlamydomonas_euryale.AAC.7
MPRILTRTKKAASTHRVHGCDVKTTCHACCAAVGAFARHPCISPPPLPHLHHQHCLGSHTCPPHLRPSPHTKPTLSIDAALGNRTAAMAPESELQHATASPWSQISGVRRPSSPSACFTRLRMASTSGCAALNCWRMPPGLGEECGGK